MSFDALKIAMSKGKGADWFPYWLPLANLKRPRTKRISAARW
jgi:hypothetical protein